MNSIILNRYTFTPRLLPSLLMVVLVILFVKLGVWQLDRAHQKEQIVQRYNIALNAPPQVFSPSMNINKEMQYLPLKVSGYYDNQHSFLLDNKFYRRRVGYEVITPFIIRSQEKTISPLSYFKKSYLKQSALKKSDFKKIKKILLVNRGWIPRGKTRNQPPIIPAIKTPLTLLGVVVFPSNKTFVLRNFISRNNNEKLESWPRLLQVINLKKTSALLNKPSYPFLLRLNHDQPSSFKNNWHPVINGPQKHWGYALQWFALAITSLLLLVVVNLKKSKI